jgi:hypothetical protein
VPLNDGQIIFNETDEAIYLDNTIGGTVVRKRYGGGNLSRSDIDMALSTTSENPVANKVLTELMLQKADVIDDLETALAVTENGVPTGCKTIQKLNTKINTTQAQVSNSDDAYSPTRPYAVGDLCIHNDVLYKCITACSAGSWATNQSCFTPVTLTEVANDLRSNLTNLTIERVTNVPVSSASNITDSFRDSDKIVGIAITYQEQFLYCFQHFYTNRRYFHVFKVDGGVLKDTGQMTINEAFIYRIE